LKRAYDATRNLPDRVLHRRRHLAVQRRLSRGQRPRKILVVCHGNVCRSPYLQAVLQRALPELAVKSAGFFGGGRPVPDLSVILSAERGLDLSRYRSRPLTRSTVGNADLAIVMDSFQARQLARSFPIDRARIVVAGDLDPLFGASRSITDPWNQSSDVFASSFDRLDRCAATLVSILQLPK
jgi:protein-tyrosine phosphatase